MRNSTRLAADPRLPHGIIVVDQDEIGAHAGGDRADMVAEAEERGESVDEARAAFVRQYEDALANPYVAAERGYVDTVITPSNTRMNVTKALRALRTKRESLPPKKHGNIPL